MIACTCMHVGLYFCIAHIKMVSCSRVTTKIGLVHVFSTEPTHKLEAL